VCLVLNKSDLFKADNRPSYEALFESGRISHTFVVSAATGDGVADMRQELRSWLPEGPLHFPPEAITDRMLRFLVAELVREQVMLKTNEEVPHASAVYVDQFQEKQDIVRISARIIVESQSQKGIIVGKAGKRIKAIGTAARLEIEKLLDKKVYLNLRAKVSLGWRNQPNSLAQLGYGEGICDEAGQMRS
jgi:GTP-binding protein Era